MSKVKKVVSFFDGMSCGQIALNKVGIIPDQYLSYEIDKYAMIVAQANYPNTKQMGSVTDVDPDDLKDVDLFIGGSPCQGFSFAGKQLNFEDPRSKLFFEFAKAWDIIKKNNPNAKFLLENVKMKKEYQDLISKYMGVEPIMINSNLVSAQNRNRLYWTNIPFIKKPVDKKIVWGHIREFNVSDNFYYSEKGLSWIKRHGERKGKKLAIWGVNDKCQMIEASHFKNYSSQRFFGIEDKKGLRYITPTECERAQTVPDNYTNHVSNSQRYKMLGNGWTVDVIAHIFKNL
ncbi:DNA methylase [Cellulophaga phage phi18:2]|uniref:DNA methylase n=2 Tax=Cellulophaga phage phi18:1 TaxID=1327982 RepID=S0A0R4_9CAUD|nr:DNA methyltransferase [Cellulophaga phage phi18:1]AGO48448.1 DNA methylase [Cellulophaga phage phi18:1]AGO49164.1 DNA methylase [Cellulophaga phage phi18:2]